ncbi:DNA-binding transcriptional regulator, MerR family [Cohaesibacter sp. ES.047]|uniref:MerR family transcriptional regulator n=1 Tax=Cohaesibacter sp. ES.047 TaxID=1798205 RepID=UPI000BB7B297|nr:helix-turn-helix domain-containing protein [Cohaesibacter sp. ES.047]SNY93056.1 DNA-binding transcriptional regulator, MerR family [Cohaesibacter sp. ES.047]
MLTIGNLSKSSGVKVPTIRYYEQIGLLAPAIRSEGNQRRYDQDGLKRLTFIRHARELGFPLDDIKSLLLLNGDDDNPCHMAHEMVIRHLDDVRERIERLKRLEDELERMSCCNGRCVKECQVLESLADHDHCLHDHSPLPERF